MRVFENRVLRRIFGPKTDEITEERRKLHNEELNDLHSSPDIIRVINSRRMRWAGHLPRTWRGEVYIGFWWRNLREGDHLEEPGIDGTIILRWIFRTWSGGMDWIHLAQDGDRWRALVNVVITFTFRTVWGIS